VDRDRMAIGMAAGVGVDIDRMVKGLGTENGFSVPRGEQAFSQDI